MAYRLSRITTRTGDDGNTGLADGRRIRKNDARIVAIGEVDELNSLLGCCQSLALPDPVHAVLQQIQNDLFCLGGELSLPGYAGITEAMILALDAAIIRFNADLPPLREFILPGGQEAGARLHLARAVCRRAERSLVALLQDADVSLLMLHYLNRLSDLLFILARWTNQAQGADEVLWSAPQSV